MQTSGTPQGVQKITGTALAAAQALTRRANRPAIRIRCVSSELVIAAVQPPPPGPEPARIMAQREGLWPIEKKAFSTTRSTQS